MAANSVDLDSFPVEQLRAILTHDKKCRVPGPVSDKTELREEDLAPIEDVSLFPGQDLWDNSLPTLANDIVAKIHRTVSSDIVDKLHTTFPRLKNVDMSNLLIAGGLVQQLITQFSILHDADIDLFVYGLTPQQATKRCQQFLLDIGFDIDKCKTFFRTSGSITINFPGCKGHHPLQFVLRLYSTASEILHGFDLGSSQVGIMDGVVVMTSLAAFCYKYRVNVVDSSRRSVTYLDRLVKYANRGFRIVAPHLKTDLDKYSNWHNKTISNHNGKMSMRSFTPSKQLEDTHYSFDCDGYNLIYKIFHFNTLKLKKWQIPETILEIVQQYSAEHLYEQLKSLDFFEEMIKTLPPLSFFHFDDKGEKYLSLDKHSSMPENFLIGDLFKHQEIAPISSKQFVAR